MYQGACETEALFHAARQRLDQCVLLVREIDEFEQVADELWPLFTRNAVNTRIEFEIFRRGQVGIDAKKVGHIADFALNRGWRLAYLLPVDPDLTGAGWKERGENAKKRRFACTIWSDQTKDRAARNLKVKVAQGVHVTIAFPDMSNVNNGCRRCGWC